MSTPRTYTRVSWMDGPCGQAETWRTPAGDLWLVFVTLPSTRQVNTIEADAATYADLMLRFCAWGEMPATAQPVSVSVLDYLAAGPT